jgi:SAM-dependent methyltransferase
MSAAKIKKASWYDYPQYYDMVMRDDTFEEADFIEAACQKYCPFEVKKILEPACGTGRVVAELASRGYDLKAFDLNKKMLGYLKRRLKRRSLQADLFQADMIDFHMPEKVDAAYNLINSFRYLLTEDAARSHLKNVARVLPKGGIYILAMHLLPEDVDEESTERWTASHGKTRITATLRVLDADREKRIEDLRISLFIRTGEEELRLRHDFQFRMYTAGQFCALLKNVHEFELVDVYDFWYDISEPLVLDDIITDTVFILQKK